MVVDNLIKKVKVECLVAFAHSRILGLGGQHDNDYVEVFNNRFALKKVVNGGKSIVETIKNLLKNLNRLPISKHWILKNW